MRLNRNQLTEKVINSLDKSGFNVNPNVTDLVIKHLAKVQLEEITKGNSIELEGVGTVNPSWRRISEAFTSVPYTSKLTVNINQSLKHKLNSNLASDPKYRIAVGASEL